MVFTIVLEEKMDDNVWCLFFGKPIRPAGGTSTSILIDKQTRYLTATAIMFVVYD